MATDKSRDLIFCVYISADIKDVGPIFGHTSKSKRSFWQALSQWFIFYQKDGNVEICVHFRLSELQTHESKSIPGSLAAEQIWHKSTLLLSHATNSIRPSMSSVACTGRVGSEYFSTSTSFRDISYTSIAFQFHILLSF